MSTLNLMHILGAALTLTIISAVGVLTGRRVKSAKDFTTGSKNAGAAMIAGTIMGTLVGGSSTVATAQLAFKYGYSAIWFNLGGGIGCLIMALIFVKPLRRTGYITVQQIISNEYGQLAGVLSSIFGSIGIFLSIVAQLLSAIALIGAAFGLTPAVCGIISCIIMACYVLFGGIKGTGIIGIIKTSLLYVCVAISGIMSLRLVGGYTSMQEILPKEQYFNLFARGMGVDGGAALSLILGVLSTQTYIQAVISGRNDREAIKGAIASGFLIPPIGLGGVFIGMYMRTAFPTMEANQALPQFILMNMPDFISGVFLAVLLIVTIGSGAGLSLGIGSILTNNIYIKLKPQSSEKEKLLATRVTIVTVLVLAFIFTLGEMQSLILQWSFMSMGLRAAVVFVPMCTAVFLKGRIKKGFTVASIIAGPIAVLFCKLILKTSFDPLLVGMLAVIIIMLTGIIVGKNLI